MNLKESSEVWIEPELTVLVRSKPEEAVLRVCKWAREEAGSIFSDLNCYARSDLFCQWCDAPEVS